MNTIRLAMVQPLTSFDAGARAINLQTAWDHATEAAARGAQLVCFPETFPGEWRMPVTWTPEADLADMARQLDVHVVGGFAEPIDADGRSCWNSFTLIDPTGAELGRYRRTTPSHAPWIYRDGRYWDFDWVPADELPVFDTDLGRIALLMCSEVYAPELSRVMALQGADLTLIPAGLPGPHSPLHATWRTLMWGRAIENLMHTATCANIPQVDEPDEQGRGRGGLTMVCSPEEVLLEAASPGVHVTTLDLDRTAWLRREADRLPAPDAPTGWRTKPGNLRDWRRQAVLQRHGALLQASADEPDAAGELAGGHPAAGRS